MSSIIHTNRRLTRYQKEKNGFENMIQKLDAYDMWYGDYRDDKKIDKYKMNYDLYNGKLDVSLYDDPVCFNIGDEKVTFDYQNISHYPLISQIAKAIHGEQEERPFKPMVRDNTPGRKTLLKKELDGKVKNYLNNSIIQPQREQITKELAQKYGVQDLYSLTPEEQQQFQLEVQKIEEAETPEKILDYIKFDFQTPTAKQAQSMLDFLVEYHGIWYEQMKGFEHAIITGEEYYYEGERNGKLVFEAVPPTYFQWGGSQLETRSQRGTYAKLESWFTTQDITQRHFADLTPRDLKDLEFYHEPSGGHRDFYNWEKNEAQKKLMYKFSTDDRLFDKYKGLDIKTKEGQNQMRNVYSDVFGKNQEHVDPRNGFGIREAHIVWRDKRILKKVSRVQGGRKKTFWTDEHYEPQDVDMNVTKHWVDEVWEGYKLGSFDCKYVGIRPVPYQYKSLSNPDKVDLPYYGARLNTHENLVSNSSIIDLGKTLQKDFDTTMASIKHDMATNLGNVFVWFMNMIPEGTKWQDWLDTIRNSGFAMADPHKRGLNQFDTTMLKSVNISKVSDIAGKTQLLSMQRDLLAHTMYFNDARLGAIGQYANAANTQANQFASYKQTAWFFTQHNKIVVEAIGAFLNRSRFYYKDNPEEAKIFLDDVSLAELLSSPRTSYRSMGITLNNSSADIRKLDLLKQQTLGFIQNSASIESVVDLVFSDTEGEVRDIIKKESALAEKTRQEAIKAQQDNTQAMIQGQKEIENLRQDREDSRDQSKLSSQEYRTELDITKFQLANDVDGNKQSDLIDLKKLELAYKAQSDSQEFDIKRETLKLKEKLGKRFE